MCGFVAIFDLKDTRPIDGGLIRSLTRRLEHRGPDGEGYLEEPGVALGHRRLAIIDVAGGQQPMFNEDRSVAVVFNGEIYNFDAVRKELTALGHIFATNSDTEVIVHGWEEWGQSCVDRFRGMFAFALWDGRTEELFLARDRLGIKPLYYTVTGDGMVIAASELKSILGYPGIPTDLDVVALDNYLTYGYVADPRTIYVSVNKLSPGHTLTLSRFRPAADPQPYWDVSFAQKSSLSVADACERLREELAESVKMRMISEVPIGAFLSGGVDSSAVVAAMANASVDAIRTCTIAFQDSAYDESQFAEEVAHRYGTLHSVDHVTGEHFDTLEKLPEIFDEPFADSSALPTLEVCRMARRHVTVVLSGDGGDENFAGYRRYRTHAKEMRLREFLPPVVGPALFRSLGRLYPAARSAPRWLRAKATFQALARTEVEGYLSMVSVTSERQRSQLYSSKFHRELQGYRPIEVLQRHIGNCDATDPVERAQYLDMKTYLPGDILTKVDRTSMANSLEVRVPLLDHKLTEWAATLRPETKFGASGEGKYILKAALEPHLSAGLLYRKKMGFAVPVTDWLRKSRLSEVQKLADDSYVLQTGLISRSGLRRAVDDHASGRYENSAALWALLVLDRFLARLPAGADGTGPGR